MPGSSELEMLTTAINKLKDLLLTKPDDDKNAHILSDLKVLQDTYLKEPITSIGLQSIQQHINAYELPNMSNENNVETIQSLLLYLQRWNKTKT